jgi:hypothetical protein
LCLRVGRKRLWYLQKKIPPGKVRYTACLKYSSLSPSKFRCRKRDLTAVLHIQLRAHTLSRRHAHLITVVHDLLPEIFFCTDKSKAAPFHAMEVKIHPFLSSTLIGGDRLALCTSRFNPAEFPVPFC